MSPKKVVKKGAYPTSGADSAALNSRHSEGNANKHKANQSAGHSNKAASSNAGSTALAATSSEPKTYLTAMLTSGSKAPKQKNHPDAAVSMQSPDQAQRSSTLLSSNTAGSSTAQTSVHGGATGMGVALRTIRSEAPVADVVTVRVNLNLPPPDFNAGSVASFAGANNLRAGEEIRRMLGIRAGVDMGALAAPPTLTLNTQYHYQHSLTPPPPSMQRHVAGSMIPALHVDSCPPAHFHQPHQLQNPPPIGGRAFKEQGNHFRDPLHWRVTPTVLPPPTLPAAYTYDAATAAAWEREQGTMAVGDGANVDDLLDLIEEFWANMDEASPPYGSPTGKSPGHGSRSADGHGHGYAAGRYTELVSDASANWGDSAHIQAQANVHWSGTALVSGSRGIEGVSISARVPSASSPIPEQFSFTLDGLLEGLTRGSNSSTPRGSTSTSPATRPTTPQHNQSPRDDRSQESSPPQSIPRAVPKDRQEEQPMPQRAHHTLPDVVATVDGIKRLILAPHIPEKPLSLLAHRIGPTLLLEGTTAAGLDAPVTVAEARKKALRHKLLYYSVLMSPPWRAGEKGGDASGASYVPHERRADGDEDDDGNADDTRKTTVDRDDAAASSTHEREPANNEEAEAYQIGRSIFRKTMQWNLSDMNILIGATQPTLRDRSSGQEVNLQVHDINDLRVPQKMPSLPSPSAATPCAADASGVILPTTMALSPLSPANPPLSPSALADGSMGGSATTTAPLVGSAPDAPKLDRSSALEYWLDNILSNVASVALCYHRDGDVQGYQVVPTHHLPQMADPSFSPVAVQASSTQVLKWLQQGTSTGGTSFVVVKDANSCELKLYDITGLSSGGVKEMLRHPDSRSKRRVTANTEDVGGEGSRHEINGKSDKDGGTLVASTNTANNTQMTNEEAATPLDSFTGALVPVSSYDRNSTEAIATGDRARGTAALSSFIRGCKAALGGGTSAVDAAIASSGAIPSSPAFKHLKYPYAMMCFRMAQCLPPLTKDAYKMWQHVATLLSVRDEEALFPLATAHVAMMEYHAAGCSQLPDSDRQAITHASRAVQALHILDRCVKQAILPQSVLEGTSAFGGGFGSEKERKKAGGGKLSPTTPAVTEEDLAQLLEDALEGDPDVTQTVEQMRGLCVRVVNCMLRMGERELVRGKSLANGDTDVDGFTDDIDDPKMGVGSVAYPAIVLGRVVENILVAQAALMLRAFEVPSGLIMANPDLVISSDVSSHQLSTTNTGRQLPSTPSIASVSYPRAASVATANTVDSGVAPSPASMTFSASPSRANHQLTKQEHTVLQCFERIATLSGDVVSTHLQHVLSHSTADAEAQKSLVGESSHHHRGAASPPMINSSETCLHRYISKLNRDLKVTFSVLEGIASSAASLGTNAPPASSITGASVPDHVNFVGRMAPLDANPITCAETAISLYQQAVGHRHSLQVWNHQQPSKPSQQATTNSNATEPIPPFYSSNALSRKIAAIHAVVAEFYARGLAAHLVPKDGAAMSPSSLMNESTATMMMLSGSPSSPLTTAASPNISADNAVMGPLRDSREANANFDRAATAFINCKDFANAALNLQNASKMCLRAAQALAKLKAVRQMSFGHADAARREAAEIEDNAAIEEEHRRAIAALEKAEQLPKGGAAGMTAAIADNVRQFAFSVYIYSFQWEMEQLARSAVSNASFSSVSTVSSASSAPLPIVSASTLKRLHDRYLAPALKIPKKLAHLMPSETQRAMEAKVLSSMINLYWLAYPSQVSFTSSPSLNMSPADRIICIRFAKTRLRQFWTGYLRGSLSPTNANVALSLWLEATRVVNKMIACDLYLFTHGTGSPDSEASSSVASTTMASPSEAAFNEKVQCVERAFTSIVDWRLWLRMAEGGLVVIPQSEATVGSSHTSSGQQRSSSHRGGGGGGGGGACGANQKKKGGKQSPNTSSVPIEKDIRAELLLLAEAALPIAKHLSTTLMCLLKLIKQQGAAPTIVTTAASVADNVKRSLQVSTRDSVAVAATNGGDNDKSRLEWLSQFGKCVDEAEKIFNGRRTR